MAIRIRNLSYSYENGRMGLAEVNLDIESGKKTAILGINGSGKSTMLYHLNGITLPQMGTVEVLGMDMRKENLKEIRRKVGFLFDYPDHQLFSTSVYQDIKFGLDNYKFPEKEKAFAISSIAKDLGIEELLDYPPYQLSLGQKKKVAIAGLLVLDPNIIVCDEPFAGLDGLSLTHFKGLLDEWIEEGKTIVFSTHDVDLTYEWADNVVVLYEGKVVKAGSVNEVLEDDDLYLTAGLLKPMLYDLFSDLDNKPRSLKEARECLSFYGIEA